MSFINVFWGLEVTGGSDQFEPLIVVDVRGPKLPSKKAIYSFSFVRSKRADTPIEPEFGKTTLSRG